MGIVTIPDVRAHLRLDEGDASQDLELQGLILAAASHIEQEYGLVAVARQASLAFDRFGRALTLPLRPIVEEDLAVSYVDRAGVDQDLVGFRTVMIDGWMRVLPPSGSCFPAVATEPGAVRVRANVGFDDDSTIDRCAGALRAAMLMIIAALYEDRESWSEPTAIALLLDGARLKRV